MKGLHTIAFILVIIGGLNWLLIGLGMGDSFSVGAFLSEGLANIIYILVGLSAVYLVATHKKTCKSCNTGGSTGM